MFCSNCGKPLIPNAAFCSVCGSAVCAPPSYTQSPQPSYQQTASLSAMPGSEDVLLIIKATRRLSMTSAVACSIVFKRNWLVLAHLTQRLQMSENARLQELLKAQNLGVMKRTSAQMHFWGDFHKRYYAMPTDAILAEDPTNQAVNYGMIALFDYANGYSTTDEDSSYDRDGKLHLTLTTGDVLKFTHQQRHDKTTRDLLTGLFGPRLKYHK